MNEQKMDGLKEIYRTNAVARAFLDHAAQRSYDQQETKVDRALTNLVEKGHQFNRKDVIDLFRLFEAMEYGQFVEGRRGHSSRFVWSVSLVSAGKVATGETVGIDDIEDGEDVAGEDDVQDVIVHTYYLRPYAPIELTLPVDLTQREADRLAMFIKSLSFDTDL